MILGFHYHVPAYMDDSGDIHTMGSQGVFLDSIAKYFVEVVCFLHHPRENKKNNMDYIIKSKNIKLVDIGLHDHMLKRTFRALYSMQYLDKDIKRLDHMLIRGPSPLLPFFAKYSSKHKLSITFMLVADYLEVLNASDIVLWKKIILKIYFKWNKNKQDFYAKNALLVANSRVIVDEYKKHGFKIYEIKTTTLSKNDLIFNKNKSLHNPIELLYTGRIESQKGIHIIIKAMEILYKKGIYTRLNLVGWETEKGYLEYIQTLADEKNMLNSVIYHGAKSVGEELLEYYRKYDIYVLASTGNFEGFPRTIWEAMASSMPVVASTVSSIPYFLEDEKDSLLFTPKDYKQLAVQIEKFSDNKHLLSSIICNAIEKVKDNTLENQSYKLSSLILNYKENKNG